MAEQLSGKLDELQGAIDHQVETLTETLKGQVGEGVTKVRTVGALCRLSLSLTGQVGEGTHAIAGVTPTVYTARPLLYLTPKLVLRRRKLYA